MDRKSRKVQKFSIFPGNQTLLSSKLLAAFVHQQVFSLVKCDLIVKQISLVPYNGNLMGQNLFIGLIILDIQTRFPSKQLLGLLPSCFQSIWFLYKMVQYPYLLFSSLLRNFNRPKLPKIDYICDASCY